jgi:hypothetical protein
MFGRDIYIHTYTGISDLNTKTKSWSTAVIIWPVMNIIDFGISTSTCGNYVNYFIKHDIYFAINGFWNINKYFCEYIFGSIYILKNNINYILKFYLTF